MDLILSIIILISIFAIVYFGNKFLNKVSFTVPDKIEEYEKNQSKEKIKAFLENENN